jgi:2-phosphosulfolactate phosphatase
MRSVQVHLLPRLVDPATLKNSVCVVIDVLRATTTIIQALAAGAKDVIPCLEIADALAVAEKLPDGSFVLGGERYAERIAGFHLGNSPAEYTPETVAGKTVIITTTNGTRAMHHCHAADMVLLASFTNLSAICRVLGDSSANSIALICAGTDGFVSLDDCLVAGAIAEQLTTIGEVRLNDEAELAIASWRFAKQQLIVALMRSRGGRNLVDCGMQEDIRLAAAIDQHPIVPHVANGRITRLSDEVRAPQ